MAMSYRRNHQARLFFSGNSAVPVGWAPLKVLCPSSATLWRVLIQVCPRSGNGVVLFSGPGLLPYWDGYAYSLTQGLKALITQPIGKGPRSGLPTSIISCPCPFVPLSRC